VFVFVMQTKTGGDQGTVWNTRLWMFGVFWRHVCYVLDEEGLYVSPAH
jgi:hypothetical protein